MDEQNVEAKLDDDSRCGCIAVAEAGLSILLARLRWSFEFGWIGFLISARYLLPVTAAFLVIAVGALAFRANRRHGYGPFALGLFAAAGVLVGKFWWESNPAMYGAVAVLVIASLWNAWPQRAAVPDFRAEKSLN